jgi:hypothetical protein
MTGTARTKIARRGQQDRDSGDIDIKGSRVTGETARISGTTGTKTARTWEGHEYQRHEQQGHRHQYTSERKNFGIRYQTVQILICPIWGIELHVQYILIL